MDPLLKKGVLAGLGFISLTKEKVEEFVDDLVKRGELQQGDKAQVVEEAMENVGQRAQEAKEWVSKQVEETWEKIRPKAQQQIDELQEKIGSLSRDLEELKQKLAQK